MSDEPQIKLTDALRQIPKDHKAKVATDVRKPFFATMVPAGRYAHEAADYIDRLESELAEARTDRDTVLDGIVDIMTDEFGWDINNADGDSLEADVTRWLVNNVADLREQVRWRKWPDEKPEPEVDVVVRYGSNVLVSRMPVEGWKAERTAMWLPIPDTEEKE